MKDKKKSNKAKTKKASVIKYSPGQNNAPLYLGTGKGALAYRIIDSARKHHIPIVENEELVSALENFPEATEIPESLYFAVAEILTFCWNLKNQKN